MANVTLRHVRKVYPNDADHIIRWCAYKVQFADRKINHALFLGGAPGIGKDTILEGLKRAIGAWNFEEVSPQEIAWYVMGSLGHRRRFLSRHPPRHPRRLPRGHRGRRRRADRGPSGDLAAVRLPAHRL